MAHNKIFERVGLYTARKKELGSKSANAKISLSKGDSYKMVIDAKLRNAYLMFRNTFFQVLRNQSLIHQINGKTLGTTKLSAAYCEVALNFETQKQVHFLLEENTTKKHCCFRLKTFSGFFTGTPITPFHPYIKRNQIITNQPQIFARLRNFHAALCNFELKAAPEKTIAVKFPGHVLTLNNFDSLLKNMEAIQQIKPPEIEKDVMKLLGASNFYSKYFPNMLITSTPLYNLHQHDLLFLWNQKFDNFFKVKQTLTHTCEIALPHNETCFSAWLMPLPLA